MIKKSYLVTMAYTSFTEEISKEECSRANMLLSYLDYARKTLDEACKYLDTIAVPFKNSKESGTAITSDQILKDRAHLRQFKEEVIKKFNHFKVYAGYAYGGFEYFSSDPQILGLSKSLFTSIDTLENKVNGFIALFDNLDSADFVDNVLKMIGDDSEESKGKDSIKKHCETIKTLIEDRIQHHIAKHVLGSSWLDSVSGKVSITPQKRVPKITKYYEDLKSNKNVWD